mmetsp:Transcript_87811/g.188383  ORF Transcript_87811/g.188383 Transcript_87811/m.188383 type:complete len:672 (-) Transcript_87811:157-2172(-)
MSGGFRDSFTKEDTKEDLLGYDDTAFYYFVITILTLVALPWTLSVVYSLIFPGEVQVERVFPRQNREGSTFAYCQTSAMVAKVEAARQKARKRTLSSTLWIVLKAATIIGMWAGIFGTARQLGYEKEIQKFDPFEILGVTPQAANPQIKRAYRKLSLAYHPDKNPDDPLAASHFIQITKAYQALTDEVARRNWERFGNPDGPQTTKVGIGLPRFLLEKDNNLMILISFFFAIIFMVPMTFICYYQRTRNFAANGVLIETLQFLGYYVTESTRVKNGPELFAACSESRSMPTRPTDNVEISKLAGHVIEHKKRSFTLPSIMKNQFLVWAHMQRRHHLLSPLLRGDLDMMLGHSVKITQVMIEIACMREWFSTAQAMIEFRRCLVQALDVKSSQLLQIPHFNEEILKHCHRGKNAVSTLSEFLSKDTEQRKGLAKMEPQQIADIEAFCAHVSHMELKAVVEVEDESTVVVGDVATVSAALCRRNLREGEAMGPVHAPLFPEPKSEEWWLFLVEAAPSTRIIAFEKIRDPERLVEEKLRFQVSRPGKHSLVLHALCDSYSGIDQRVELNFTAYQEEEVKREIVVHPEDEDLDLQPTLFQQFMGELNREEESEEEEEVGNSDKARKSKVKKEAVSLGDSKVGGDKEDSDDEDEDDGKKGGGDDGDSDSSSSASGD